MTVTYERGGRGREGEEEEGEEGEEEERRKRKRKNDDCDLINSFPQPDGKPK